MNLSMNNVPLSQLKRNRIINNPQLIESDLRKLALKKYKRDKATCNKEQFVALYLSACYHALRVNPNKFTLC